MQCESRKSRRSGFLYAALAGILCASCGAQHPKSFSLRAGTLRAIALELLLTRTWELITRGMIIARRLRSSQVWGWTLSRGTNPIGWLRFNC